MQRSKTISHFQLFCLMFITGLFSCMMYSVYFVKNTNLLTYAISAIIAALCLFVITAPLIIFCKNTEGDNINIIKAVQIKKPVLSGIFTWVYAHYFIYSAVLSLAIFALLLSNFINPGIIFWGFIIAAVLCCYYAAYKGLTSMARSGTLFFVIIIISIVFICISLSTKINTLNYAEIFNLNGGELFTNTALIISQASSIPAIFVLADKMEKNLKKPLYIWIIISSLTVAAISAISSGVLGNYTDVTPFPFYTAAQMTEIGAFERLDAVFLAVWTVGMFVNVSVSMLALRVTLQSSFCANKTKYLTPLSAVTIIVFALIAVNFELVRKYVLNVGVMTVAFITAAFILPLTAVLLLKGKRIGKRGAKGAAALVLVLLLIPVLTGCGDDVQLHERLLIKGIGIDKTDSGYSITAQYIDNHSENEVQSVKAVKTDGATVSEAVANIRNATGGEPFLGQNTAIVIGNKAAQANLEDLLDYFVRYCDSRPTVKLFISETTAEDILTLESGGSLLPIDQIGTASSTDKDNIFTVLDFINSCKSETDTPTASMLKIENGTIMQSTVAVFGGDNGLYKLDLEQLEIFKIVNGIAEQMPLSYNGVSCAVKDCGSSVIAKVNGGNLYFSVNAELSLNVLENPGNISQDDIEKLFRENLNKQAESCLDVTLKKNKCDIYNLGENLRWNDYEIYSKNDNYGEKLSNCTVKVNINCKIINIGY